MENTGNCTCGWKLERASLLYVHDLFVDTEDYLADGLFIRHKVTVHFGKEFGKRENPTYRFILCKVRKRDETRFLAALQELPAKMLLCGHTDYPEACDVIQKIMDSHTKEAGRHAEADSAAQAEQTGAESVP